MKTTRRTPSIDSLDTLYDPWRYERQIKHLYYRTRDKGLAQVFIQEQFEVPLINFYFDSTRLSQAIANNVKHELYYFKPHTQFRKQVNQKVRVLYDPSIIDKIVAGVVANILNELIEPYLSKNCFAYRPGSSPELVVKKLSHYLKSHEKSHGLYFIKTDIRAYTDSIPVGDNSELFKILDRIFQSLKHPPSTYQINLIKSIIRPAYINTEGHRQCNLFGLPMGIPITTSIANIYASEMDYALETFPDLFYVRYCDDIFIAHQDYAVLLKAISVLDNELNRLCLSRNAKKDLVRYFNKSGRADEQQNIKGTNFINYLGFRISSNGLYCVSKTRQRRFLKLIRSRVRSMARISIHENLDTRGKAICSAINAALSDFDMQDSETLALLNTVTDHNQLKHLDFTIALYIAEKLSQVKGVKAFRHVPYKKIRDKWGLLSLIQLRNQASKQE